MGTTSPINFVLTVLIGTLLGLIGSGGYILTVPILVYVMDVDPVLATSYSLFIVGITSLVGGIQNALQKNVDYKTVFIFGIPSILVVYFSRAILVPIIPDEILSIGNFTLTKSTAFIVLYATMMIAASISMFRPFINRDQSQEATLKYNYPMIVWEGIVVGILTGLMGAGGGFLIVPALVLFARMPMKLAVGTSLFIIAAKSLLGFVGDLQGDQVIDWQLLFVFTLLSVVGIFIGIYFSGKIEGNKLETAFGWLVLVTAIYILIKELFL